MVSKYDAMVKHRGALREEEAFAPIGNSCKTFKGN